MNASQSKPFSSAITNTASITSITKNTAISPMKNVKFVSKFSTSQPYLPQIEHLLHHQQHQQQPLKTLPQQQQQHQQMQQNHRILKNYSKKLNLTSSDLLDRKTMTTMMQMMNTPPHHKTRASNEKVDYWPYTSPFFSSNANVSLSSTTVSSTGSSSTCSSLIQNLSFDAKLLIADIVWSRDEDACELKTIFEQIKLLPQAYNATSLDSLVFANEKMLCDLPCIVKVVKSNYAACNTTSNSVELLKK